MIEAIICMKFILNIFWMYVSVEYFFYTYAHMLSINDRKGKF